MHDQLIAMTVFLAGALATLCASAQTLPSLGDGAALAKQAPGRQPGPTKELLQGKHIFMTYTPTEEIRPDQPLRFRFWLQGSGAEPIRVDFDDGAQVLDYRSYAELTHSFRTPGIHIVTAQCQAAGSPIMQKVKVVVHSATAERNKAHP